MDLKRTYDAIVVGSGAAGGMAAHVLTSRGLDVLLLEAGKQLDTTAELRSLEWPYDHPRRGDMPYTSHALRGAEYALRKPPYATKDSPWKSPGRVRAIGWGLARPGAAPRISGPAPGARRRRPVR